MPKPNSDCRATERKHPWPMVRLGELGTMVRGNGIKRSETIEKGCPCLRYGEIYTSYNVILDEPKSFVAKELFDRSVKIKKGDLVFTLTGENTEEIAKALAYLGDDEIAAGGDLAVWTGHGCDSKYLAYLMYSPQLISQKAATGNGNIVVHTSIKKLQQLEIPLPPLSVQREIVARLERELAAVEKMKKGFETLAETAKAEFKAELKEMFEEISRRGAETRRLGEVCDVRDGTHDTPVKCDKGYLLLTSKNVRNGKVDKANAYYISASDYASINKRSGVDRWDVLFSMIGTVGETAIVDKTPDFAIKNMGLFKTHANELLARWIKYYFDSQLAKQLILDRMKGSNQKFLSLGALREFPLTLTNRDSMIRLVSRLDGARVKAEKLESKALEGVAACETIRKAILKEAFE